LHGAYIADKKQGFVIEEGKCVRGKKQGAYRVSHDTGGPSRMENQKQWMLISCEGLTGPGKCFFGGTRAEGARRGAR